MPTRRSWLSLCAGLLCAAAWLAVAAERSAQAENDRHDQLRTAVDVLRVDLDFDDEPIARAIRQIADDTQLNIIVDEAVRDDLDGEEITVSLRNLRVGAALELILDFVEMRYTFKHGVIWITTPERSYRGTSVMRTYDVRDIIMRIRSFPGEAINLPDGSDRGSLWRDEDPNDTDEGTIEIDDLIDLIPEVIEPESWDDNPEANIMQIGGTLVVYQTPEVHGEIAALLDMLR